MTADSTAAVGAPDGATDHYRSLAGSRVVVTGGASGIGLRTATRFAGCGASVVLWDASPAVAEVALRIGADHAIVDVTDRSSVERAAVVAGEVDVLCNVAGVFRGGPADLLTESDWAPNLAVNLVGTFMACQVLGRGMLQRGRGAIVNVSSQAGTVALAEHAAYSASKAGVVSLTRSLAAEWGPSGVRVNAVSPGVIETPMSDLSTGYWSGERGRTYLERMPLRRFGEPDDVAAVILFLASDSARMVTGANIPVDGGFTAT